MNYRVTPVHSFVDYIQGGCQINLLVAIDFTVSYEGEGERQRKGGGGGEEGREGETHSFYQLISFTGLKRQTTPPKFSTLHQSLQGTMIVK